MKELIITGEQFSKKLEKLELIKQLNWENFYIDRQTGEKWKEEYPNGNLQGGGLPQLKLLEKFPWE